jgi:hypothetical protein
VLGCPELLTFGNKAMRTVTTVPLNATVTSLLAVSPK